MAIVAQPTPRTAVFVRKLLELWELLAVAVATVFNLQGLIRYEDKNESKWKKVAKYKHEKKSTRCECDVVRSRITILIALHPRL